MLFSLDCLHFPQKIIATPDAGQTTRPDWPSMISVR